jgi:hypothetical protein
MSTTTRKKSDAIAAYDERYRQVLRNLERIREALERHVHEFDGRNWGFVGDLAYVIETTGEAADFLERSAPVREIIDENPAGEG